MANQKNNEAAIKNLENQVGQLAKQIAEQQPGPSFSGNTQINPKEHCKSIVTRSGKEVNSGMNDDVVVDDDLEVVVEREKEEMVVEVEKNELEEGLVEKKNEKKEEGEKKSKKNGKGKEQVNNIPIQNLPYPHAPSKKDNARHYARFLDIFNQLQINIPFFEAIEQIPTYAKFMKDILTK